MQLRAGYSTSLRARKTPAAAVPPCSTIPPMPRRAATARTSGSPPSRVCERKVIYPENFIFWLYVVAALLPVRTHDFTPQKEERKRRDKNLSREFLLPIYKLKFVYDDEGLI